MKLYYRIRKQGAVVFRMEVSNRQRRVELNQIAIINGKGEIRPHNRRTPSDAEIVEIAAWWADWEHRKAQGDLTDTEDFMATLNQFTQWVEKEASQAEINAASDPLLLALLDLRQTIVRRLSETDSG